MTLVTPADAKGPVPVMMMFGGGRSMPGDHTGRPRRPGHGGSARGQRPAGDAAADRGRVGLRSLNPASVQADNGAGLTRGIIGLVNKGQRRKPDDWGSLRAWAWGASRGARLSRDRQDSGRQAGRASRACRAMAKLRSSRWRSTQRFAVVLVGSSGEGGAKLHRRNWGEAVENLTGSGEYHWMAGNFLKYGAAEATFGSKNAGDIPVDSHQLIALCAPRLTFISYGIPEKGDAKWLDQQGSFMAAVAAGPVFRLLGAKDLGTSDDYKTEKMPAVNVGLLDGQLAWRQHDGGHTDGPNWKYFLPWADRFLRARSLRAVSTAAQSPAPPSLSADGSAQAAARRRSALARTELQSARSSSKRREGGIDVYFDRRLDHSTMGRNRLP